MKNIICFCGFLLWMSNGAFTSAESSDISTENVSVGNPTAISKENHLSQIQILKEAKSYLIQGKNSLADSLLKNLDISDTIHHSLEWKALFFQVNGLFALDAGEYKSAEIYFRKSLYNFQQFAKNKHFPEWLEVQNHLGRVWILSNELEKAKKHFDFILSELPKIRPSLIDSLQLSNIYNNIGVIHFYEGEWDEAYSHYDKSRTVAIMSRNANSVNVGRALYNMGLVKEEKGFFIDAQKLYEQALAVYTKSVGKEHQHLAEVYGSLGNIHLTRYELSQAQYYFQKDLDLSRKLFGEDHLEITWGYENLARVYQVEGKDSMALQLYEKVYEIRNKAYQGKHVYISNVLLSMAELDKNALTSVTTALKALNIENHITSKPTIGKLYIQLHLLKKYTELKKWSEAKIALRNAKNISQKLYPDSKHPNIVKRYVLASVLYEKQGLIYQSKMYADQAILSTLSDKNGWLNGKTLEIQQILFIPEFIQSITQEIHLTEKFANIQEKKEAYKKLSSIIHVIQHHLKRRTSDDISKNYSEIYRNFFEAGLKLCLSIWEKDKNSIYLETAFNLADHIKRIQSLEVLQGMEVHKLANLPEATLRKEYQLKKNIVFLQSQLIEHPENRIEIIEELQKLYKQEEEFYSQLKKFHPDYFQNKYLFKTHKIKDLQSKYISGKEALLHSTMLDGHKILFVITKEKIRYFPWGQKKLDVIIQALLDENIQKLIVIPDAGQEWNEWEIIRYKGKYLIEFFSFIYNVSASHYFSTDRPSALINRKILAFAPVDFSTHHLNDLPSSEEEIKGIRKYFKVKDFLGEGANKEQFFKDVLSYGGLHISSHVKHHSINPLGSLIYFFPKDSSDDGKLHAYEIFGVPMRTQLVVLSACETKNTASFQSNFTGIADAFFYNGCRNILLTLSKVDDKAMKDIMMGFYKNLSDGHDKEEALRLSKLDYLKSADKYKSDPMYWSGVILQGDMNEIELAPSFWSRNWWLVALLIFVVTIIFIVKVK